MNTWQNFDFLRKKKIGHSKYSHPLNHKALEFMWNIFQIYLFC